MLKKERKSKLTFDKSCTVKFKNEPTKTSKQARIKETKLE